MDAYLPFLSVFFSRAFWVCCCLPSSPFFFCPFLAFGRQELSSKILFGEDDKNTPLRPDPTFLKPEKKKKKKEDFGAPKAKTNHHLKKLDALENTSLVREEIDYNGGTCFV